MDSFIWTIIGAFLGTILGFLATKYFGWIDYHYTKMGNWFARGVGIGNSNPLLQEENNIYNSFTSFDKSLTVFSEIVSKYLKDRKIPDEDSRENCVVITNIKEPIWYWEEFRKTYTDDTEIGKLMEELESNPNCTCLFKNIKKIADAYFKDKNNSTLFPHQKIFKEKFSKKNTAHRINSFQLVLNEDGKIEPNVAAANATNQEWKDRNSLHTLLFFYAIFEKGVKNWVFNPFDLSRHKGGAAESVGDYIEKGFYKRDLGTDAIIFDNKIIFNYDSEIGAINYYKINHTKKTVNSFFSRVEEKEFSKDGVRFEDFLINNYDSVNKEMLNSLIE